MVHQDRELSPFRRTAVLLDVTTIIGAEEFIKASNKFTAPGDPFARQAFVELVQSLIFMSRVLIAHPTLSTPRPEDFGPRPWLLRTLMSAGLIQPLQLDSVATPLAADLEQQTLADLQSWQGNKTLAQFIEQTLVCDREQVGMHNSLSGRIHGWADFQAAQIRSADGHRVRIDTTDGIEEDDFGLWARAAAIVLQGALQQICPAGEESYVAATLARGLKYRARAESTGLLYQAHPIRRDFLITFDLARDGVTDSIVLDVIKAVRGIHRSLASLVDESQTHRVELVELELPLLGGRLWKADEVGRLIEPAWIELITGRILEYRDRAAELRHAIEQCVSQEDYLRLVRDIDGAKRELLERLGIRQVEVSPVERDLVNGVASVAESVPGMPKVSGLWLGARKASRQLMGSGTSVQRFLYKEFAHAWKQAGR
jgi:hypothetical protein